jgi:hypothetical protein
VVDGERAGAVRGVGMDVGEAGGQQVTERDEVYDRAAAYEDEDGRVVYRASSLGACDGALVRARLGVTGSSPTDVMQTRFDEGHEYEAEVITRGIGVDFIQVKEPDHLALHGRLVEHGDIPQIETEIAWGNKVVRCHPDGIVTQGSTLQQYVTEAKFFGSDLFYDTIKAVEKDGMLGLGRTRAWQASVEMLSTGLPLLYIIGLKDVVEVDGERVLRGVGEVWTTEFDTPCYSLRDVKARVLEIEGYVARGEMPPCPVPFDYPCPYWDSHEAVEKAEIDNEVLKEWVGVWRLAAKAKDQADKDLEFAKAAVAEQMCELGLGSGRCDGVDIAVVAPQTQGNISWGKAYKALAKKSGMDVDDFDAFRGQPSKGYVRIQEVKDGG